MTTTKNTKTQKHERLQWQKKTKKQKHNNTKYDDDNKNTKKKDIDDNKNTETQKKAMAIKHKQQWKGKMMKKTIMMIIPQALEVLVNYIINIL